MQKWCRSGGNEWILLFKWFFGTIYVVKIAIISKGETFMKTTVPNFASGEHKKIIMMILALIVVVAVIAALIVNFSGNGDTNTDTSAQSSQDTGGTAESGQDDTVPQLSDEQVQTQIEDLVARYRTAFVQADIETLKTLYNTDQILNSDVITATAQIITAYENTACYIKEGMDESSKVVFIYDDLKIDGIETLIPNISYIYVMQKDDGSYYIYPGEYSSSAADYVYSTEIQKYINERMSDSDIRELYTSTSEKLTQAMTQDSQVKSFVESLTEGEMSESAQSGTGESVSGETGQSIDESADVTGTDESSQSAVTE